MAQNKVKWEQGSDEVLSPFGTVEIHSDEGDVIGFVFPQYADTVQAAPDLLAAADQALTSLRQARDAGPDEWATVISPEIANAWDALKAAIAKARGDA